MERSVRLKSGVLHYTLLRTNRRSGIAAKVLPDEIRVYIPQNTPLRQADAFVQQNAEEILEAQQRLKGSLARMQLPQLSPGMLVPVQGTERRLDVRRGIGEDAVLDDRIVIYLPDTENRPALQSALRQVLVRLALRRFQEALDTYSPRIGGTYHRVTVRDQKTRWGSCSAAHNLNFNWRLILAPPEVLEYVVIHELCHLWEFNHSRRFWALVASQMPEYEIWKKWLKQYGASLQQFPA